MNAISERSQFQTNVVKTTSISRYRKLTISDAIYLGISLGHFRDTVHSLPAQQLRKFGFLRLWHAKNHRTQWGADYRARYEEILQEAREAFRLAKLNGHHLP